MRVIYLHPVSASIVALGESHYYGDKPGLRTHRITPFECNDLNVALTNILKISIYNTLKIIMREVSNNDGTHSELNKRFVKYLLTPLFGVL